MPEHVNITDPNIHEPKGVATATSGEVYVANGTGSGAWVKQGATIHAAAKVSGNSTEITPSGAGTFMEWTPSWTSIDEDGVTITSNSFVITEAGSYFIIATLASVGRGTGANTYAFDFAKNGTVVGQKSRRTTSSTSDVGSVTVLAYLDALVATDVIKLYVTNETDTDNVLISDANFVIYKMD